MHKLKLGKLILPIVFLAFFATQGNAAITLIEPLNNQMCVNMNTYFDWDSVLNVDHYNIKLSISSTFHPDSTWISTDLLTHNAYALGTFNVTLMPTTKYYWKVIATFADDEIDSSSVRAFTTKTDYAIPKSPVNIHCVPIITDFTVETYLDAVDSLRILVAKDRNFDTIVVDKKIANPEVIASMITAEIDLINPGTFYWTTFQFADGCWSDSVEGVEFSFQTVLDGPVLVFPENNAKGGALFADDLPFQTNLYWHPIEGATYYKVRTSNSPNFDLYTEYVVNDTNVLADFGSIYNTNKYWKVAAFIFADSCQTLFSETRSLKTPYQAPELVQPQNGDRCIPINVNFTWDSVFNAITYRLQVATAADFADTTIIVDIDSIPQPSQIVSLPSSMTKYYWRVRVENAANDGLWSQVFSFESAVITPSPIYPEPNSVAVPLEVHFQWSEGIEGTTYTFQISDTSSMDNLLLDTLLNVNSCDFDFTEFFKTYYWRVKAYNLDCESAWSDVFQFKTQIDAPFGLVPPNDSTFIEPLLVRLSWKAPMGALKYDLDVALDSDFTQMFRFERNITSLYVLYDNLAENTDYYWRVRAKNLEGASQWTATHHFKTGYIRPDIPTLVYPANGAKKIPINLELRWNQANRALQYHLQFASDENFQNIIVDDSTSADTLVYSITGLDNNRTYYWRVEAKNLQGSSGFSPIHSFLTIPLPPVGKVQLVFPDSGAIDQKVTLELKWDSIPNVLGYRLQIARDRAFTDFVENNDKVWITSKLVYNLPEKTKLYWRVRGWNDGGDAEWSNIWEFTTEDVSSVPITNYFNTTVFPSPAEDYLNVKLYLENSSTVQFQFIDLQGKLITEINLGMQNAGEHIFEVNSGQLPAGMYIYKIIADGKEEIGKIIKK